MAHILPLTVVTCLRTPSGFWSTSWWYCSRPVEKHSLYVHQDSCLRDAKKTRDDERSKTTQNSGDPSLHETPTLQTLPFPHPSFSDADIFLYLINLLYTRTAIARAQIACSLAALPVEAIPPPKRKSLAQPNYVPSPCHILRRQPYPTPQPRGLPRPYTHHPQN